jgi:Ca2+-binding EF-hand superfamily protein
MIRPVLIALAVVTVLIGSFVAADAQEKQEKRSRPLTPADTVRTLIEMSDQDPGCTEELQQIYDMLRKLDTNKNGKLDAQALKAAGDNILKERVKEVFDRLDKNKDGKISRDEAQGRIKEDFDKIDTNKDGFIEIDELLKAARERHEAKSADTKATTPKPTEQEKK